VRGQQCPPFFRRMRTSPTVVLSRRIPGLSERVLSNFLVNACRAARLKGTATLLVTSSRRMRQLNAQFRGKDYPTDVLSFPSPSFVEGFSGDIAISGDMAARNAQALGHSVGDEVKILVLHGVLHLAGYDHVSDNGQMAEKELRLRRKLGLPAALIERAAAKRRARLSRSST
jgi:probable rRNA maturation factor